MWLPAVVACVLFAMPLGAQVEISGRVLDENDSAIDGARVSAVPEDGSRPVQTVSDARGHFSLLLPAEGAYVVTAEREGFFESAPLPIHTGSHPGPIEIGLTHQREHYEAVEVRYSPPAIDAERVTPENTVRQTDLLLVPYPSSHSLNNALRMMPGGVIQDANGELHFNGGASNQAYWTLDGFNITDPLNGRFASTVSVQSLRSASLASGVYSAEYGKGSAGAMALTTDMGADRFRYAVVNLVPGFETRGGLSLGDWRPRFNISGPIRRGRAWFFAGTDIQSNRTWVQGLPKNESATRSSLVSEVLRTQVNVSNANTLHAGGLFTRQRAPRYGLGAFDPPATTIDRRAQQQFVHIKDQHTFQNGLTLEAGYARNRVFDRESPQGEGIYIFTPYGRQGFYYADSRYWANRHQALVNALAPIWRAAGTHLLRTGADVNWVDYRQDVRRTGFDYVDTSGAPVLTARFRGDGAYTRRNFEAAWYAEDTWQLRRTFALRLGMRLDADRIVHRLLPSPRLGAIWAPGREGSTKISGGYAVVYDATTLELVSRQYDQYPVYTRYGTSGNPLPATATLFTGPQRSLRAPRYQQFYAGLERKLPFGFYAQTSYLRRLGKDGFTYSRGGAAYIQDGVTYSPLALSNTRSDRYNAFQLTLRRNLGAQGAWLISYTRSHARSTAVLDLSVDTPVSVSNNYGSLPWDTPNRLMSWGYVPVGRNWILSYLAEWRSGYPYSLENKYGEILGPVNSRRLPGFFEADVFVERRIGLFGHFWGVRAGVVNVLNRQNPTWIINNVDSPQFQVSSGGNPRAFVTRIRWMGRKPR